MSESICDLTRTDDRWRKHAGDCTDCRDLLVVGDWMHTFADRTSIPTALPSAGYLLVKSRIQHRRAAAERAARPIYAMAALAGVIFAFAAGLIGTKTHIGSVMIDSFSLLTTFAIPIFLAAVAVAIAYAAAAFLTKETRLEG